MRRCAWKILFRLIYYFAKAKAALAAIFKHQHFRTTILMTQTAADTFRDYAVTGVPASGVNQVSKSDVRGLLTFYESLLSGSTAGITFVDRATLYANIAYAANVTAIVYNDTTANYNGLYQKYGASGAGSWNRIGDLPNSIVRISATGGTGDAIIATAPETPIVPGNKLYLLTTTAANTTATTINVNGAGAVAIMNAFGSNLAANSLLNGSQVLMAWAVDHYQLLISASVDASAILAAAQAAATASAASATASSTSSSTAQTYALVAGAAAARFARIATTANQTLSGLTAIDGVTPVAGDKILAKAQTTLSQNGVWLAAAGAWTRPTDFNSSSAVLNGYVIHVSEGTANANRRYVLSSGSVPIVIDTSLLTFTETTSLIGDSAQISVQQSGAGTVPLSVAKIINQWNTLLMYGGGPDKTAAQNAAAFLAARDGLLLNGGTLTITPGSYACDPVNFIRSDVVHGSMKIQGTSNPSGPANNNSVITFTGTGATPFWSFNSPSAGTNNGSNWTVDSLYFNATDPTFSGALISSTTAVTDGSKITGNFRLENCVLGQAGGVSSSCTLLDIGKSQIATVYRNVFGSGVCQIKGQQGQTVAGVAQARQDTCTDIRKNTFNGCNGYPIQFGGEAWNLQDNIFEPSAGGRMRVFTTNSNYPIRQMTWINNWCGDTSANPGDQAFLFYGQGLVFMGNYVSGLWTGSGPGFNAIYLNGLRGFNISGNSFDYCSAAIASQDATTKYGSIEGNVLNIGAISTGAFDASVRIAGNGI
jgi:hypothetical protein